MHLNMHLFSKFQSVIYSYISHYIIEHIYQVHFQKQIILASIMEQMGFF